MIRKNRSKLKMALLSLGIIGALTGCYEQGSVPVSVSDYILTVARFDLEAKRICDDTQRKLAAVYCGVAVYNSEYTYRYLMTAPDGTSISQNAPVRGDTYLALLDSHLSDDLFLETDIAGLVPGPPKEALIDMEATAFATVPLVDSTGYLYGYVVAVWDTPPPSYEVIQYNLSIAQAELERLTLIFNR